MNGLVGAAEQHRSAWDRLLEEVLLRHFPARRRAEPQWQAVATEPTAWVLLALYSSPWASSARGQGLTALLLRQQLGWVWPTVGDGAGANFWATATAVNGLMILGAFSRGIRLRVANLEIPRISAHTVDFSHPYRSFRPGGANSFPVKTESSPRILAEDTTHRVSVD
jgi:hypothetical protein